MVEDLKSVGDGEASDSATRNRTRAVPLGHLAALPTQEVPLRCGDLPFSRLADLYMAQYSGRDPSRLYRLRWWAARLGSKALADITDDDVHDGLEVLRRSQARFFAGSDADGRPILRNKKKPLSPASVNRYAACLAAVMTWAIKRRIAPKGYAHPCKTVDRQPERNEKTRFLSAEERASLLQACRDSRWPKLYLLVLMALTTGARKSELLYLRWEDIDFERAVAHCRRSKNGDAKVFPLVPATLSLLQSEAQVSGLVFDSKRAKHKPFCFDTRWHEALKASKVKNFRFHDLRHTCASMLAQEGATLLEIADVLGHRQLQVTKRYSHLTVGHKSALVNRVLGGIK